MKSFAVLCALLALGLTERAHAGLYGFSSAPGPGPGLQTFTAGGSSLNQLIPDNTAAGVAYSFTLDDLSSPAIQSITFSFNISGGYNGDLYAYLSHGSDFTVLLNRVGTGPGSMDGYANPGFDLTLGASGYNIHNYQDVSYPLPQYNGYGQLVDGSVSYTADDPIGLSKYLDTSASGAWTVFFVDLAPGDASTLHSFELSITAVPEPITMALGTFAAIFAVFQIRRRKR